MDQGQQTPSTQQRPWYYHNWFLIAAFILGWPLSYPFVLWPVWGVLTLRSPWHNHILIKGLAWANLITGGVLLLKHIQSPQGPEFTILLILPGVVVTLLTQVMWTRYKLEHGLNSPPPITPPPAPSESPTPSPRARVRRRIQRRRRSQ